MVVTFQVLGAFEVRRDGAKVDVGPPRQRCVLAALLMDANRAISPGRLVDRVWGPAATVQVRSTLYSYVSRIRAALAGCGDVRVDRFPAGYMLRTTEAEIDLLRFRELIDRARGESDDRAALTFFDEALRLYCGEPFAGLDSPWLTSVRATVEREHQSAVLDRTDVALRQGRHHELVRQLPALAESHLLDERLAGQLMLALYRCGRPGDALAHFRRTRQVLVDELGLDPGVALRRLHERILRSDPELDAAASSSTLAIERPASPDLPETYTRFFGRVAEVVELHALVEHCGLVTLVGPPGGGKTRLAIEVGERIRGAAGGSVCFAGLAAIADPALVPSSMAAALGIAEVPGRTVTDAIAAVLRESSAVLIVDNCEHVAEATSELVATLVSQCRDLHVLATSRIPLGLPGEHVWRVPPLDLEPSVALFADRAAQVNQNFQLDHRATADVEQICRRLDGLPLAIELAAAWSHVLAPHQILTRLEPALTILTSRSRRQGSRHRAMEATVRWSYRLLEPAERELFTSLSVFAGWFDLAAAEAVTSGSNCLEGLTTLVEHSLLLAAIGAEGCMRYRMLEPVRQCAAAMFAAADREDVIRHRHAEHYLNIAQRCNADIRGERAPQSLRRLTAEADNLRQALLWTRTRAPDLGLRLCIALGHYWELRGRMNEGRRWLEEMLRLGSGDERLAGTAQARLSRLAWRQWDYPSAQRWLERSLGIARRLDDPLLVARRLRNLALIAASRGQAGEAERLCREAIEIFEHHDDEAGQSWALFTIGLARYTEGDFDAADEAMREALRVNRRHGSLTLAANAYVAMSYGGMVKHDTAMHRAHLREAIALLGPGEGLFSEPGLLWSGGALATHEGRFEAALRLAGAANAMRQKEGGESFEIFQTRAEAILERARTAVGEAATRQLMADGAAMTMTQLFAELLAEPKHS
jgi:predicted ATPase/DNA-binding SARP family transcriptional activator